MKKGIKILAVGGLLTLGLLFPKTVSAATDTTYNINVHKKYVVMTDEDTIVIPDSYVFDDNYSLSLTKLQNNLYNIASKFSSNTELGKEYATRVTYNTTTKEFSATYGITSTPESSEATYNSVLVKPNGQIEENYNSTINKEYLVRLAEYYILNNSKKNSIKEYQQNLEKATTELDKTKWSSLIEDYQEDVERMDKITISDIPANKTSYNTVTTSILRAQTKMSFNSSTGEHISDTVDLNYYYYTIIIRDLRLSELNYSINSGEYIEVPSFDLDKKEYNISLPSSTPKNAVITTNSTSFALEQDTENNYIYDSGITVEEGKVTLNNGVGTAKVKVKFDATPYGDNGTYTKEYTLNFSIMEYQKGDVNHDGYINSTDAAIVLDLFKNGGATEDNYAYGDMNNDNLLNSTDAAMILDIYKNS